MSEPLSTFASYRRIIYEGPRFYAIDIQNEYSYTTRAIT